MSNKNEIFLQDNRCLKPLKNSLTCTIALTFVLAIISYVTKLTFFSVAGGLDITSSFASSVDF